MLHQLLDQEHIHLGPLTWLVLQVFLGQPGHKGHKGHKDHKDPMVQLVLDHKDHKDHVDPMVQLVHQ
jgi:hypothetical protein